MMERDQTLQRERAELSQNIHNTTAHSVHMVGVGPDTARFLAGNSNPARPAALESTAAVAQAAAWELPRPINGSGIFQRMQSNRALRSRFITVTNITL